MSSSYAILALLVVITFTTGLSIALTFVPCYSSLCSEDYAAYETRVHIGIYYGLLLSMVLMFTLRSKVDSIKRISKTCLFRKRLPLLKARITWGGVLAAIWILFVVLVTTALWLKIKPTVNELVAGLQDAKQASVSFTVTNIIGHHIDLILGLVIIPVPRHSVLCEAFGFPGSTLLWAHTALAYLLLIGTIAHGAAYMSFVAEWVKNTLQAQTTISILNPYWPEAAQSRLGNYALVNFPSGILLIVSQVLITITALSWVRRRHYELFYYSHILLGIIFMIFACVHVSTNFYALLPGLFLWTYDLAWRLFGGEGLSCKQTAVVYDEGNGWCRVTVLPSDKTTAETASEKTVTASDIQPLQTYYINVPTIDKIQCHPLSTITAQASNGGMQFLIRAGQSEMDWASHVFKLPTLESNSLQVRLEGPYTSKTTEMAKASDIICIVGGTGITGALSIADWWLSRATPSNKLTIIWTVRDAATADLSDWIRLCSVAEGIPSLHVQTHFTSQEGRLDSKTSLRENIAENCKSVWVYVSGPESLLDDCEDTCIDLQQEMKACKSSTIIYCHTARWEV